MKVSEHFEGVQGSVKGNGRKKNIHDISTTVGFQFASICDGPGQHMRIYEEFSLQEPGVIGSIRMGGIVLEGPTLNLKP